jgi:hypothetical protein
VRGGRTKWTHVPVFLLAACGAAQDDPTVSLPRVDKTCLADKRDQVEASRPLPIARASSTEALVVPATAIAGKRTFGRTVILPDEDTQDAIRIEAITRICPRFELCLDERGAPQRVELQRPSCFPRYEALVMATMREWRYSPYTVNGSGVKVCTSITLCYSQPSRP